MRLERRQRLLARGGLPPRGLHPAAEEAQCGRTYADTHTHGDSPAPPEPAVALRLRSLFVFSLALFPALFKVYFCVFCGVYTTRFPVFLFRVFLCSLCEPRLYTEHIIQRLCALSTTCS